DAALLDSVDDSICTVVPLAPWIAPPSPDAVPPLTVRKLSEKAVTLALTSNKREPLPWIVAAPAPTRATVRSSVTVSEPLVIGYVPAETRIESAPGFPSALVTASRSEQFVNPGHAWP